LRDEVLKKNEFFSKNRELTAFVGTTPKVFASGQAWQVAAGTLMALWTGLLNPLVGTEKIAPAPDVVHGWHDPYLQSWPRHHAAGALACRIFVLFCSSH